MSDETNAEGDISSAYDELINVLLPAATEQLEESGHFSPVAAFVSPDGTVSNMAVEFDDGEPEPAEIVEALQDGLREQVAADAARATAICSIVMVSLEDGEPTDAICVNLEQHDGDPLNVFLPFAKAESGYDYQELVAGHGTATVFGGPSEA